MGRDSDPLRAGRSGDRIPAEARFSAPVRTDPGAHLFSCAVGAGIFSGAKRPGRGVALTTHSHIALRLKGEKLYFSSPSVSS